MVPVTLNDSRWRLLTLLLFVVFLARIASLYTVCSDTYDEHAHIFEPLSWLETGEMRGDRFHAPLARFAIAIGPWLAGFPSHTPWFVSNWTSQDFEGYWRSLTLARLGVLPFVALLFWTVALWSKSLYGAWGSIVSVIVLSCCPTVIGHSALAALDVPGAAGVTLALVALWHWMRTGSTKAAVLAGASIGFAQMLKFSAFGFLLVPVAFAAVYLVRRRLGPRAGAHHLALMGLAAFIVIWASYGFEIGQINSFRHELAKTAGRESPIGAMLQGATTIAPNFWTGFLDMAYLQQEGFGAMFLGESGRFGWPAYFPIALLLKSTPPLLILAVWGLFAAWKARGEDPNAALYLGVSVLGMIAVSIPSRVNIGVRHIMPVFPLLSLLGGGIFARSSKLGLRSGLALLLIGWQIAESAWAHPDYIAYFTPLARARDYHYLSDSNLTWGQDRWRLIEWLRSHPELKTYVVGADRIGMLKASGWVNGPEDAEWLIVDGNAASIILAQKPRHGLAPVLDGEPWGRIGRSMLVFRRGKP
jgi:4-amino-4-deoxy-L-arabinose transferase-like glycosyltransferase